MSSSNDEVMEAKFTHAIVAEMPLWVRNFIQNNFSISGFGFDMFYEKNGDLISDSVHCMMMTDSYARLFRQVIAAAKDKDKMVKLRELLDNPPE